MSQEPPDRNIESAKPKLIAFDPNPPIKPPSVHSYTIKTNINFTVKATSITAAYKQFEKWIVAKFEEAYANGVENPIIVPNWYEGLSVEKDEK